MGLDLAALVTEQDAALADDSSWLGSPQQLQFLTDVVHDIPGLGDVNVAWVEQGDAAYWEAGTRTITAERLSPIDGYTTQYLAKMVLIGVLHETLHARYSTPTPLFQRRMRAITPLLAQLIQRMFNFLEDGRITALGKAADPGLTAALDEHLSASVTQLRRGRDANAETETPADPRQQLLFALEMYALTSEVLAPLHPDVGAEFARLQTTIDRTRGGSTDDCGLAAIVLAQATSKFKPSS